MIILADNNLDHSTFEMKKTDVAFEPNEPLTKSTNQFPVVGIGASAGGLEAFKILLEAIPENSGMAYVLVQHLDPNHDSLLPELLQKVTGIPVSEITDDIKVEPDHIYIIPSNKIMVANDGVLRLTTRPAPSKNERNMPIDLFFNSLAEVHQSHSIGVVLSGNGSDGTKGLQSIKDQGGLTFAQDRGSAANKDMPHGAAQAGVVDFILEPDKIPGKLLELTEITNGKKRIESPSSAVLSDEVVFSQILALIRMRTGTDFTFYKKNTIDRRILRRMALNKNEEPTDYLNYLIENKQEQDILYQDFLIPVTEFFRDKKSFKHLCETIIPQIIKDKPEGEPIRVWVAGCSTGEEAISVAICFKEIIGDEDRPVQIFATDISEPAIAKARAGIYKKSEVEGVSPKRLNEFFIKRNGGYQVNKQVRDMCVFALHNFVQDPPFGRMDLITCRNVLIYMKPYLQKKALTTFHYALNLKGFLMLGKTETVTSVSDLFASVVKDDKLFSRKDVPCKFMYVTSKRREQALQENYQRTKTETLSTDYRKAADDVLLKKYMPAGVVVNESFDIVNYRGKTNDYLEQLDGMPSHNLLQLAKKSLAFHLRTILHKAKKEKTTVVRENIAIHEDLPAGQESTPSRVINIEAIPLDTLEPHFLVLFHETPNLKAQTNGLPVGLEKDGRDVLIQQLEQQLVQTHEDMRSITEEQEATNEELQSGNEELLSSSEELQSLNEELETSKEELQSTNEELTVLNQELVTLSEQVTEARDYSEAIVSTVHSSLIVLDKNFRVKFANKTFYKTFAVGQKETEGVVLYDLGNNQWDIPRLREFLQKIVPKNAHFNGFEVTHNFPDIGEKVMLLNASRINHKNKKQELILLSIKDVTEEVSVRKKVEESEKRFHNLVYSSPAAICILAGEDMVITTANKAMIKIWGKDKGIIGKKYFEALPEMVEQGYLEIFARVYKTGRPFDAVETPIRFLQNREPAWNYYNFVVYPQRNVNNEIEGIGIIAFEVTSRALTNQSIKSSEERFRSLAQTLPQLIWVTDAQGNMEFTSSRWKEYAGIQPATKEEWKQIMHPDDYEKIMASWADILRSGTVYNTELRLKNKEDKYRWHIVRAIPVMDEEKKIVKWVGSCTDIQDQKVKEEEKDEFIGIASHELKTPLTTAKAYLQMLEISLDENDKEAKLFAEKASQSVNRLNDLIGELLDVSKIQFGKLDYTITTFDFNKMIDGTVESIQLTSPTTTIVKTGKAKDNLTGDRDRLQQVVINLLSNAIKYSPDSEKVFIKVSQRMDLIKVSVQDTGIGIGKHNLHKIFEKYHRVEEHSVQFQGMGIGLFISYEIIRRHGGKLWAESEKGKGSTFHFSVPITGNNRP